MKPHRKMCSFATEADLSYCVSCSNRNYFKRNSILADTAYTYRGISQNFTSNLQVMCLLFRMWLTDSHEEFSLCDQFT